MHPVLVEIFRTQQVIGPDARRYPLHSNLPELECRLLQAWIAANPPRRVLEIGMAQGISSVAIAEALAPLGEVWYEIIDPNQSTTWASLGVWNLNRAGFADSYNLQEEPSEYYLPVLAAAGETIDLVFVDGWHTFEQTLVEFYYINRLLPPGGIVIFDDIQLPAIAKFINYLGRLPAYQQLPPVSYLRKEPGVRVRRMSGVPEFRIVAFQKTVVDTRPWDWFENF